MPRSFIAGVLHTGFLLTNLIEFSPNRGRFLYIEKYIMPKDPPSTTKKIMSRLTSSSDEAKSSLKSLSFIQELRGKKNLMETQSQTKKSISDVRLEITQANPQNERKLTHLFNTLNKLGINPNKEGFHTIKTSPSEAGYVSDLLELAYSRGLSVMNAPLPLFFNAAKYVNSFRAGVSNLEKSGNLSLLSFTILLAHPMHGLQISDLLNTFQSHFYSIAPLETTLSKCSSENIPSIVAILKIALNDNVYYEKLPELFMRQQAYADTIYRGTVKLAEMDFLTSAYFEAADKNPSNANFLAKIILLLASASLINHESEADLMVANSLSSAAHALLSDLNHAQMLSKETYNVICQNSPVLADEQVVTAFKEIPLGVSLSEEQLTDILHILNSEESTKTKAEAIVSSLKENLAPGPKMM